MKEYNDYYIEVIGLKNKINDINNILEFVNELSENYDCVIQLMDASAIAGKLHAYHACIHAISSLNSNNNVANKLGMEICVRASAQRQISKAINILGLKKGKTNICAVIIKKDNYIDEVTNDLLNKFRRDDSVLIPDFNYLKKIYNISCEIEQLSIYYFIEKTTILTLDV